MNFNDDPERLKIEEQKILDSLINDMDEVVDELEDEMQKYVDEAKNMDISLNPDNYLDFLLTKQGKKNNEENRKIILQARDELYHTRLLLQYETEEENGFDELKVGLHSCIHQGNQFVISWEMPICRQYILDNSCTETEIVVEDAVGREFHTKYKLLVKNQVELRFTRVKKALNMYPGLFDDKTMKVIRGTGFFSSKYIDEMISKFNPDDYNPDEAAKIIADDFLRELLERRSTPEFKNIVFSIQKKQGEIIQAPYRKNMIVQGCAGSGKSMIMLHRLPIILYDNPNSLSRAKLYVITPSQMYIQLAENMRYQLEISDINMGTVEQYYDYCIEKYPGHKAGEYGRISYATKIGAEHEKYVYSKRCINDIKAYYNSFDKKEVDLTHAYALLNITESNRRVTNTFYQKANNRLLILNNIIRENDRVLAEYHKGIIEIVGALTNLHSTIINRKELIIRELTKRISKDDENIKKLQREIDKLDIEKNEKAIKNRLVLIDSYRNKINLLSRELQGVEYDEIYFSSLMRIGSRVETIIQQFSNIDNEFINNSKKDIYDIIKLSSRLPQIFERFNFELSKLDEKYSAYLPPFISEIQRVGQSIEHAKSISLEYLDYKYYNNIRSEYEKLLKFNSNAVNDAYGIILDKIGIKPNENGKRRAVRCSPYIYLQALYLYNGAPDRAESMLAIDEVQGFAPEEIRLLKNINGNNVIFNMFGDVRQHIEGTKGVDRWSEYKDIIDYDYYEMLENYRNASQITEYCNRKFRMKMNAINTPGKGVHELKSDVEFEREMIEQLIDTKRAGLSAILVSSDAEARYLLNRFSRYSNKFHDMTDEEFSIHHTRWNIINIDDAKGLEFSSVIVLAGNMSRNQRYIAYTRALDDLYVYNEEIDVKGLEKKPRKKAETQGATQDVEIKDTQILNNPEEIIDVPKHSSDKEVKKHVESAVRQFFIMKGLEVIDLRDKGGRLWVVGEKTVISDVVNEAISKFGISGKYTSGKDIKNKNGWCTKSDK